jgi:hypothetical protein
MRKFEKTNSKTFFGKNNLLHDLVSLGNFLSIKFMKCNKQLYASLLHTTTKKSKEEKGSSVKSE